MNLQCIPVSSMSKIFPDGQGLSPLKNTVLSGLRGEILSFQIACRWGGAWRGFGQVRVTSPISSSVRVREVRLSPSRYPCHTGPNRSDSGYLRKEPGLYPDRLSDIPSCGFSLVSDQWTCLWVDIDLPKDSTPGEYPLQFLVSDGQDESVQLSLTCRILDAVLPKLPIPHTEWFHSDCLANYYGVEIFSESHWRTIENFVRCAAKYGCNMLLTPVFTPPLDTAVGGERPTVQLVDVELSQGEYRFGFEKFRRWVNMALDCGMEYIEISHLFTQWGAKSAPKIMATVDGQYKQLFGWDTDASGKEYQNFLRSFLKALKPQLSDLGISDRTYFHISDEPGSAHLESYRSALETVKDELSGFNMIDALSDYSFYKEGLIQQPVCSVDHIGPFLENRPNRLWCYYCTSQCVQVPNRFMSQPGSRTRILGTLMYKYRIDGFLHWGYNFYSSQFSLYPIDPYSVTDADGAFPSGDPFLVYPGPGGVPEGSIRQMLMYQAMADLRALYALESLIGREKTLEYIEEPITFSSYPMDEEYLLGLRDRVNSFFLERQSAGESEDL